MQADAIIEVRFRKTVEGGRQSPIAGTVYACPVFVDGEGFDCRLSLGGRTLQLGKTYEISVKFMNPEMVLPKLTIGKTITLWEGKEVATGKVVRLIKS